MDYWIYDGKSSKGRTVQIANRPGQNDQDWGRTVKVAKRPVTNYCSIAALARIVLESYI